MAIGSYGVVDVYDWSGPFLKHIRRIDGLGSYSFGSAVMHDGCLLVTGWSGSIRIGDVDDWDSAIVIENDTSVLGVIAGRDGGFATTDSNGKLKLWRDGKCVAAFPWAGTRYYYGVPMAVVGSRLVVDGGRGNILVYQDDLALAHLD